MHKEAEIVGGPLDGETIVDDGRWKLEDVDQETQTIHVYQKTRVGRYEYRGTQPTGFPSNTKPSDGSAVR